MDAVCWSGVGVGRCFRQWSQDWVTTEGHGCVEVISLMIQLLTAG